MKITKILVFSQPGKMLDALLRVLSVHPYHLVVRSKLDELVEVLRHNNFDLVLIQGQGDNIDQVEALLTVRDFSHELPVLIVSGKSAGRIRYALKNQNNVSLVSERVDMIQEAIETIWK